MEQQLEITACSGAEFRKHFQRTIFPFITETLMHDKTIGLFEMFPEALQAGMMLSLPTLLFYLFVYHIAARSKMKTIWVKVILTTWVAISISLTLYLLDPWFILPIGSYYIIANSICGLLLKMKRMPKEMVYSENT